MPFTSNCTSIYLPKRDELSLRLVFALPNASSNGLLCSSLSLTPSTVDMCPEAAAIYCSTFFDASVLPAPLSPTPSETAITIDMKIAEEKQKNWKWWKRLKQYQRAYDIFNKPCNMHVTQNISILVRVWLIHNFITQIWRSVYKNKNLASSSSRPILISKLTEPRYFNHHPKLRSIIIFDASFRRHRTYNQISTSECSNCIWPACRQFFFIHRFFFSFLSILSAHSYWLPHSTRIRLPKTNSGSFLASHRPWANYISMDLSVRVSMFACSHAARTHSAGIRWQNTSTMRKNWS